MLSPRHGAERSRRACTRCLKLYVILKLSWDKDYVHLRKYTFFILRNPTKWAKIPSKYTLMFYIDLKKGYHTLSSCSSCDAGVGHVTRWPKTTEETAQFSSPSFLHFLLWPVVPRCEGHTHKANGGENKGLLGGNIGAWQHRGVATPEPTYLRQTDLYGKTGSGL